jgi:hypothetical protein
VKPSGKKDLMLVTAVHHPPVAKAILKHIIGIDCSITACKMHIDLAVDVVAEFVSVAKAMTNMVHSSPHSLAHEHS